MTKNTLCLAILPALALAMPAKAGEDTAEILPAGGQSPARDMRAAGSSYPLVLNVGEARAALAKAFASRRQGKVEFSLRGAGIDRDIAADCSVTAGRAAGNGALANVPPSAIMCSFHETGRTVPARLTLRELRNPGASDQAGPLQRGELTFDGLRLQIAPRQGMGDAPGTTPGPDGYMFTIGGLPVGSVELAGRPAVRLMPGKDVRTRRAVMLAATTLGVLWSPQGDQAERRADDRPVR